MKKSILRATAAWQTVALLGASAAFVTAVPAAAQNVTAGELSGTVVDPANNPVANATVVVTSTSGVTRSVTTSAGGTFNITQLPVGNYNVRITAPGFPVTDNADVGVQLGGANYTFQLAAPTSTGETAAQTGSDQSIVVTGRRIRTVDFSGTATGQVFSVQQVAEQIPIPRTIQAVQLLAPQTTTGDTAFDTQGGRDTVSIAGSSIAENIYYINGMNITNFRTFVGGSTVPFEFYDQVQVKTGGYQAEFGRNTGGAVIAISRSGSNDFRGGINFNYRPNFLSSQAKDTYGQNNDKDVRRLAEGNVWASGPIIKDRVFFFGFFNPRYSFTSDTQQDCGDDGPGSATCADTTTTTRKMKDPFWGAKLDVNLFDGHRLEGTIFKDKNNEVVTVDGSPSTNFGGGKTWIARYTGNFTDWFTLSGLIGNSRFNQTSQGADDADPYVLDFRTNSAGTLISGNPAGLIETGEDTRRNYRVDADFNFELMGTHRIRLGADREKLTATNVSQYSGGQYNRFNRSGTAPVVFSGGTVAPNTDYVRIRTLFSGGEFLSKNTAFYIQDSWDVTDRLNLSLGIRNDRFVNYNALGEKFTDLKNQWGPRVGFNFDPFGDKRTRISGFFGRYYIPVAANTNIRLAGNEEFIQTFYRLPVNASGVYTGDLVNPAIGAQLQQDILSAGGVAPASTLVSKNLKPQYLDEMILGGEHRFANSRWTVRANLIKRKLGATLEDMDFDGSGTYYSIVELFCDTQNETWCNPSTIARGVAADTLHVGSGGYVLINPGADLIVDVEDNAGNLHEINIPQSFHGFPKAKRNYWGAEFQFERAFDGKWGVAGSYVYSSSKGNIEGGVKSDIGQDDTGLTQDFDELGWTDGANGYLPNHRRHTFKAYGAYQLTPSIRLGFNALVQSPRKFGCIGIYPLEDNVGPHPTANDRANNATASSWYCRAQVEAGRLTGTGANNWLIGRGNAFESDWHKRIDLSAQYTLPQKGLNDVTFRIDVFNAFNFKSGLDYNEFGDNGAAVTPDLNYGRVLTYQTPRYVRLGASVSF